MKVALVNASPYAELDERESRKAIASFPPLGLLYLASSLKENGDEVSILDQPARGFTVPETIRWIEKVNPDVLGFSTFSSSGRTAAQIAHHIKKRNPHIITVLGNHYATFNSERILRKYPSVDITVRGEGEQTIIELVNCLTEKVKLAKVAGINFRTQDKIISTPDRPLIKDLDTLPIPDRSLLEVDYHCRVGDITVAPKKFTSVVSSRGCVFKCRFCSCTQFARNEWRPRSVRAVLDELHFLASEGYSQFIFVDDSFTLNSKRVIKLCRKMKQERLNMDWICEGRVNNCSFEMVREMVTAGCKLLFLGIESANQRILDYYHKQITPQQSVNAVKMCRKAGMDIIIGSFIVGGPDETREEINNTIEFAQQLPIDLPQFNLSGIYPGTDLWDEFIRNGIITGEEAFWETGIAISEICSTAVPTQVIRQMIHNAFYNFIRRPRFILTQMAKIVKSSYRTQVFLNSLLRVRDIRENLRYVA